MKNLLIAAVMALLFAAFGMAQPRPVDQSGKTGIKPKPAPESFPAKYEGGIKGSDKKLDGTLKFDDANNRLVFYNKDNKEILGIGYDDLVAIYPQSQSVTSPTGSVVSHIPLPGAGLAGLIKEKRQFLVLEYDDPYIELKGLVNFRIENKEMLDSVLQTLADKAKMVQRGEAYFRPKTLKS